MQNNSTNNPEEGLVEVFTRFITRKGKRIYHPNGGFYHFFAKPQKEAK